MSPDELDDVIFHHEKDVVRGRLRHGEWTVFLAWPRTHDEQVVAQPVEMLIQLPDAASPQAKERGLTSSVLRPVEAMISEITAYLRRSELPDQREVDALLAELATLAPHGQRPSNAYYLLLVECADLLVRAGSRRPAAVLSEALGLNSGTVRTQLRTARSRRQALAHSSEPPRERAETRGARRDF